MAAAHGKITRRGMLGMLGASAIVVAGARTASAEEPPPAPVPPPGRPPRGPAAPGTFHGLHQQGITTPAQERLAFSALDLTTNSRAELIGLLQAWTRSAAELARDGLTITMGFGPTVFRDQAGRDRFGLQRHRPPTFGALPAFANDQLVAAISGGDVCLQVCAHDEMSAQNAMRQLVRNASGLARVRWSQAGFGRVGPDTGGTPRNLFGFKDGSANIAADDYAAQRKFVWVQADDGPAWLEGGSFLAARKISMNLDTWDDSSLTEQEQTIGRAKESGAPLSGGTEFTPPNLAAHLPNGHPAIDPASHVAVSHPATNDGQRILRRGYNYIDGTDPLGRTMGGLFFLGYVRDLQRQFIPMMHRLAASDRMNEYVSYLSSSAFAIPPGVGAGGYLGQTLLES